MPRTKTIPRADESFWSPPDSRHPFRAEFEGNSTQVARRLKPRSDKQGSQIVIARRTAGPSFDVAAVGPVAVEAATSTAGSGDQSSVTTEPPS